MQSKTLTKEISPPPLKKAKVFSVLLPLTLSVQHFYLGWRVRGGEEAFSPEVSALNVFIYANKLNTGEGFFREALFLIDLKPRGESEKKLSLWGFEGRNSLDLDEKKFGFHSQLGYFAATEL